MKVHDTRSRSIAKAITWRASATLTTFLLVYIFTGKLLLSIQVGVLEVILKMTFYFFHERIWNNVRWGRNVK